MHIHIHLLIQKERLQSNPTPRKSAQKPNSNKKNISHPRKGQQEVQIPDLLQTNPQALSGLSNPAMLQTSFFVFGGHLQYNQKTQVIYCCFACTTFIVFPNLHDIFWGGDFSNIRTSPNSKTLTPQKTRLRRFHCQVAATQYLPPGRTPYARAARAPPNLMKKPLGQTEGYGYNHDSLV